ncbi:MAG: hypothetical protein M1827_005457 [Pycnora praestabilis]|nr:MAG: hypothetical protein M1827_005457 [Pycnora praestabilis]
MASSSSSPMSWAQMRRELRGSSMATTIPSRPSSCAPFLDHDIPGLNPADFLRAAQLEQQIKDEDAAIAAEEAAMEEAHQAELDNELERWRLYFLRPNKGCTPPSAKFRGIPSAVYSASVYSRPSRTSSASSSPSSSSSSSAAAASAASPPSSPSSATPSPAGTRRSHRSTDTVIRIKDEEEYVPQRPPPQNKWYHRVLARLLCS